MTTVDVVVGSLMVLALLALTVWGIVWAAQADDPPKALPHARRPPQAPGTLPGAETVISVLLAQVRANGDGEPLRVTHPNGVVTTQRSAELHEGADVRWRPHADRHRVTIHGRLADPGPIPSKGGRWRIFVERARMIDQAPNPLVVVDTDRGESYRCAGVVCPGSSWVTYTGDGWEWGDQTVRVELHTNEAPILTGAEKALNPSTEPADNIGN